MPNSSANEERELLPLSYLSDYGYCPRRCALHLLEQVWVENEYTAAGRAEHERVHTVGIERRGTQINLYEFSVFSRQLGVSGFCDCVELNEDPNGISLPFGSERYTMYPVEYKHGIVRNEPEYRVQLCAQAMCLEERYGCMIPRGALFFIDAHRRDEVMLTEELRGETRRIASELADLSENAIFPTAVYGAKCKKCSLYEICQPKVAQCADTYCRNLWNLATSEEELP
ncbi:MAG: CRISPR-associated protein Cas4 [Clostridia bacterium]